MQKRISVAHAESECYLCVEPPAGMESSIILYTYGKGTDIMRIKARGKEGQSYPFKKISPEELHEMAIAALNGALNDTAPRSSKILDKNFFRDEYAFSYERKAAAYECMRNFHKAFEK